MTHQHKQFGIRNISKSFLHKYSNLSDRLIDIELEYSSMNHIYLISIEINDWWDGNNVSKHNE